MLGGRLPSLTAMIVASARGGPGGPDPVAHRFFPPPLGRAIEVALRTARIGLVPHLVARTRAIDAAIREHPTPQLVVLGAGLDARAHRMEELSKTTVFEIDHPATQRYKRARAGALPTAARELRYVPVDFERDDLACSLDAAGHSPQEPTTWIWEGVTMYLTREAVDETLSAIARRSANGSILLLTYVTPELTVGSAFLRAVRPFVRPAFEVLGEPLRFTATREEMAALASAHGFTVMRDLDPPATVAERVLLAIRRASMLSVPDG